MRHYSTAKRKMEQLREISTFKKLEQKLQGMEYDEFNEWLKSIGLLHNHRILVNKLPDTR
jgi:beta-N-acetylglucosaminidase